MRLALCCLFCGLVWGSYGAQTALANDFNWQNGHTAAYGQPIRLYLQENTAVGFRVVVLSEEGAVAESVDGPIVDLMLRMPESGHWVTLRVYKTGEEGESLFFYKTLLLVPARNALIEQWLRKIESEDGTSRRADSVTAPGQCKRYLINSFAEISQSYVMREFPDTPLAMPEEHHDEEEENRGYGAGWQMPDASEGNPFYEVARFDYQNSLTKQENRSNARAFLTQAEAGDVMQMVAVYNNGKRGTHTLLFTRNVGENATRLRWADSNFRMKTENGVRYGYVVYNQSWNIEEVINWLMETDNGATIYRLREDLIFAPEEEEG